jgi:hypothetical protein
LVVTPNSGPAALLDNEEGAAAGVKWPKKQHNKEQCATALEHHD